MRTHDDDYHPVDELLQGSMAGDVPAEVQARLGRHLSSFERRLASGGAVRSAPRHRAVLPRWAKAIPVAAAVALLAVGVAHWLGASSVALADVLEHVRTAQALTYDLSMTMGNDLAATSQVMSLESGRCRITMPQQGIVMIMDPAQGKALSLVPAQNMAMLVSTPPPESGHSPAGFLADLRRLREGAEEHLGQREIAGQSAIGFRVAQGGAVWTIWAHHKTGFPIRVEFDMGILAARGVMENFRFDADLDESLFSLTPPEGYTLREMQVDSSAPTEEDLVGAFRFVTWLTRGAFPPEFSVESMLAMAKELRGTVPPEQGTKPSPEQTATTVARAFVFVALLKPENDWHYAGEGVKLGDADRPVCWWRPDGADTYRVIYGDLSIRDVAADELPAR